MSAKERDRPKVVEAVREKPLRQGEAAERLGLSVRQVKRPVRARRSVRANPGVSAKASYIALPSSFPIYAGTVQLRTLQRRVQAWRRERAMQLVFGNLN